MSNRIEKKSACVESSVESRRVGEPGSRVEVGVEVCSRGMRHGGGCIDCVRLVRREEVWGDRERGKRERTIEE